MSIPMTPELAREYERDDVETSRYVYLLVGVGILVTAQVVYLVRAAYVKHCERRVRAVDGRTLIEENRV